MDVVPGNTTLWRWQNAPTLNRQEQTGNAPAQNLRGEHQFLLILCRLMHPKATADEVIRFIAFYSANPRMYTRQDISKREIELGFTRKCGSTTAFQAFTPLNLQRRQNFWTLPFPLGVVGIPRALLIDIDECGLWLEKKVRGHGKTITGVRVRAPGVYGHGEKWSLILGIDCSGMVWVRFAKVAGTTAEIFDDYVRTILNTLAPPPAPQRTFMWDNLTAHNCARVYNRVVAAGHRVLRRPAYRPVDGPIEYVFNQLQCQLTNRIGEVTDDVSFSTLVHDIITKLNGFDATFVHCGYT
jgi:hypothetical protein